MFKKKQSSAPTPRSLEDIKKAYADAKTKLADANYLVFVYERESEAALKEMLSLNEEAAARNELDKKVKEELDKKEVANV